MRKYRNGRKVATMKEFNDSVRVEVDLGDGNGFSAVMCSFEAAVEWINDRWLGDWVQEVSS